MNISLMFSVTPLVVVAYVYDGVLSVLKSALFLSSAEYRSPYKDVSNRKRKRKRDRRLKVLHPQHIVTTLRGSHRSLYQKGNIK